MTMTRKSRARGLALATAVVVVLLAALFAALRNRHPPSPTAPSAVAPATAAVGRDETRFTDGRRAYERLNCASCHSIGGRGNPSNPLDGVGTRLDRAAIHDFVTGTGSAREALGANLARRKARALEDPDLEALIDYLTQLR
jgi:mono/diheme cytochrome c family protein